MHGGVVIVAEGGYRALSTPSPGPPGTRGDDMVSLAARDVTTGASAPGAR
jgi:hypothetical protein